jgi:hypothetical protein
LDVLQSDLWIAALIGIELDHSEYVRPIYAIARHARAQRPHVLLDRFGFHLVVTPSPSPPLEQRAECFTSLTACPLWRPRLGGAFSPIVQFVDVFRQYTGNQPVQIFHCLF